MSGAARHIERLVRPVPDWPQAGVVFRDISPLLGDATAWAEVVDELSEQIGDLGRIDAVLGVEARGFLLGVAVARTLGVGFIPVRKAGKLPADVVSSSYDLEYGSATIEMHADALEPGARVVVVDDVLATGGTLQATIDLVNRVGAEVLATAVMIEIDGLGGRDLLTGRPCLALHTF
ncbi:adenine phosphoribosyltransferase [Aeromicrobium marinum DSM 15272]|uniref:Adenine phosphoribosyltransferase n=1 Tax=Aeromicrobium marinum DSM 15272 TaxID=585531 RepID=E2S9E6_9ACTN|nr:adenine phosphoribosyltransferase [Aeromicrobium marinum]EFQ83870.1 adenine phosphoribosyltransferase [Aeromicrobium marinum DSM 15272]